MANRLNRLRQRLLAPKVEQTAACARALTGLLGRMPAIEVLPAQQMTRATLTGEVLRSQNPVPWPAGMMRQLDPADPAFLPPMGLHPVLAGRDRTLVGIPGRKGVAWVDPLGWCGVGLGPTVSVWFGEGRDGCVVGRVPGQPGDLTDVVHQRRGDDGLSVVTSFTRGVLTLTMHHWPVVLQGQVAWVLYAKLELGGPAPRPVRLAFAIRPACNEGATPVFELNRDKEGLWTADGTPILAVSRHGDEILQGAHGRADPFHRFSGLVHSGAPTMSGNVHIRCPAGQATAAEVYRTTMTPGEPFSRFVVLQPPPNTPSTLMRTTGQSLWSGALADRRGVLASGAKFQLERHDDLFVACRQRILLDTGETGVAGLLAAVALARMGFVRRAGTRLSGWMNRVRRDGTLPAEDPADAAMLAWAASEFVRWTQDAGWRDENLGAWRRLLNRLVDDPGEPGGRLFFGADGSGRWTALWRTAALLGSSVQLRSVDPSHNQWALAGGQAREALSSLLGDAPWSAAPGRVPNGAAAAMLAVAWVGIIDVRNPDVLETMAHVKDKHCHGGGVFLHGGAHPAATALLSVVAERAEPTMADPIDVLAALASPTGAIPTAVHPTRGALVEGDDLLSASMFALMALDRVRASRDSITILPDLVSARELPTPFGRIDVVDGQVMGKWIGKKPRVIIAGEEE
ncbi:MAG: hypothetical protein CL930_04895 [Deltaproteobacteria bacterium]|nr:hypothetical protein [Deltaproteobacteria bacterium]